jgi:hypothetical protein
MIFIKEIDITNLLFIRLFRLIELIFPPETCKIRAKRIRQ